MLQQFVRAYIPKTDGGVSSRRGNNDARWMPRHVSHVTGRSTVTVESVDAGMRRGRAPQLHSFIVAA